MSELDRSRPTPPTRESGRKDAPPRRAPAIEHMLQLQGSAGNRATLEVVQRLPERWRSTGEGPARVVDLSLEGNSIWARIVGTPDGDYAELRMGTQTVGNAQYLTLHHIESHPPRTGLGALLVLALAKLAVARSQPFIEVDLGGPTALAFYRKMGFQMDEQRVQANRPRFDQLAKDFGAGADGSLVAHAVADNPEFDRLAEKVNNSTLAHSIWNAEDEQSLRAELDGPSLNTLDQLMLSMTNQSVLAMIPGLDRIATPYRRLQYLAEVRRTEFSITRVGQTNAVLAAAQAQVDASWTREGPFSALVSKVTSWLAGGK